jgi:small subunit ribosomal protein S17
MAGVLRNSIKLGQVIPSTLRHAVKVQVPYFEFDPNLKAYFKKTETFLAENEEKSVKTGDMVIIRALGGGEKKTRDVTHRVQETVFKLGDIKDPISGEMVVGPNYREELKEVARQYGSNKENFDYEEAPERGRLEGIRDFTDKPTYRQWHEFEKKDPYSIQS